MVLLGAAGATAAAGRGGGGLTAGGEQFCLPVQDGPTLLRQRSLSMAGKTVVITGGDSGIGYNVALGLASAGARLLMLGYHQDKAMAAAANLTRATGNHNIQVVAPFDLASLPSVRATADKVLAMAPKIDVLVCDAGINTETAHTTNVTDDGFEITFQVTFLGHFLLTESLLPSLRAAGGRVVNTACVTQRVYNTSYTLVTPADGTLCNMSGLPEDCLSVRSLKNQLKLPAPYSPNNPLGGPTNYGIAFHAKTMYAYEFSAREAGHGVSMYGGYPGLVDSPGNGGPITPDDITALCDGAAYWWCSCVSDGSLALDRANCALSAARGAAALAFLAAVPDAVLQRSDGRFYNLCVPLGAPADQYRMMEAVHGTDGAAAYARGLTELWAGWTRGPTAESSAAIVATQ